MHACTVDAAVLGIATLLRDRRPIRPKHEAKLRSCNVGGGEKERCWCGRKLRRSPDADGRCAAAEVQESVKSTDLDIEKEPDLTSQRAVMIFFFNSLFCLK